MESVVRHIPEHHVEGKRLGRHVEHDPRSRDYAFEFMAAPGTLRNVHHRRYGGVFDQGNLGSCTGNATAGAVNTAPIHHAHKALLKEADAVAIYELATTLDNISGSYPPDDTGSSGLSAAKAAKQKGYIATYRHAFNMQQALAALQLGPVITGVDWYEGFDTPDPDGIVRIAGQVRGGHEFEVVGFEVAAKLEDSLVICKNSWGESWGKKGGFAFTVATWQQLLDSQGDVTILS